MAVAIDHAREALNQAKLALAAMWETRDPKAMKRDWTDFLMASGRVYSKFKEWAKQDPDVSAWYRERAAARAADPLLNYLHKARNIDEHGLTTVAMQADNVSWHLRALRLQVLEDHDGTRIPPPTSHAGAPLANQTPYLVGGIASIYLEQMIDDAQRQFGERG